MADVLRAMAKEKNEAQFIYRRTGANRDNGKPPASLEFWEEVKHRTGSLRASKGLCMIFNDNLLKEHPDLEKHL